MIVRDSIKVGQKPTEEQLQMIRDASARPVVFDEDCPQLTQKQMKAFECAARNRNRIKKAN